jgi:Tol biopolymer transport system component
MRRAAPLLALATLAIATLACGVSFGSVQGPAQAAFLGDNGRLVYSRYSRGDLHTVLPDGTAPKRLTADKIAEDPAWSTNGKVAFARYLRKVPPEIYVKKPGSNRTSRLTNNSSHDLDPAWSPDGSKIAFERDHRIWVMNATGSGQKDLGLDTPLRASSDPAWSPDGSELAFESGGEIWTANADGSGAETRLTDLWAEEGKAAYEPDWSPDGSEIVFAAAELGCCFLGDVWSMNADGAGMRNLTGTAGGVGEEHPVWSPDGSEIAYVSTTTTTGRANVWRMAPDGGDRRKVPNTSDAANPDWRALPVTQR